MDSRAYSRPTPSTFIPDNAVKKYQYILFVLSPLLLLPPTLFVGYMQYSEENARHVCVMPPFPVGICGDVVAEPGDSLLLDEIVSLPETGPVVHNYWARINGQSVPVEVVDDGHNGVDLYATVPDSEAHSFGRSALTPAQQLFQRCINLGGTLYGLDEDGDGFMAELGNSTGDVNAYPCVLSGSLEGGSYDMVFLANADRIGTDRNDMDATIH